MIWSLYNILKYNIPYTFSHLVHLMWIPNLFIPLLSFVPFQFAILSVYLLCDPYESTVPSTLEALTEIDDNLKVSSLRGSESVSSITLWHLLSGGPSKYKGSGQSQSYLFWSEWVATPWDSCRSWPYFQQPPKSQQSTAQKTILLRSVELMVLATDYRTTDTNVCQQNIRVATGQYFKRIEGFTAKKKTLDLNSYLLLLDSRTISTEWYAKPSRAQTLICSSWWAISAGRKVGIRI